MSKEKQIEELAKIIAVKRGYGCNEQDHCDMSCQVYKVSCIPYEDAEIAYNAGYRKQSGWISVEDRLPTWEDGKVLIFTAYGISIAQKTTTNHWMGENAIPKLITHWMPLPEPPMMEGGE